MLLAVGGVPYDRLGAATPSAMRNTVGERGLYDVERPPKLSVIPGSRTEVISAARLLKADNVVLTGGEATESRLKAQDLGDFGILHFAVHAFADPEFPARAALVLLSDASGGEDGLLQPREISGLALNASLVVLSACDTAVGPTIGQEGVQNLARAFLLAGARSVVTTLWAVNDTVSLELMREFYTRLANGLNVAAALTEAKREVSERMGPPATPTLAAFQVVGAGDARVIPPLSTRNVPQGEQPKLQTANRQ
jgi:CHAT domain-containing protein